MAKEMLINVSEGEECRIALLEDGTLHELYMERSSSASHVNNIYKGRVTNVEASIQAAFIDFGLGRNGFLHISDLMPTYFGRKGEDIQESVGRKMARRDRPPIQRCLRRGDEIVVQIIKEGIGTKGPTLTSYLSIPGKILVMMPGVANSGVSRKIEDEDERRRLRKILDELDPPDDAGFIIRTAGIGATKTEIQRDLNYLARLWTNFKKKRDSGPGPMELYTEGDLVTRTVRDVFTSDIDRIVIDNEVVADRVREVIKLSNPRTKNNVELYEEAIPLFHKYGIEREIELMYSRHVPLISGGSLVIDSTEAIVAIDVNSGKFRDHSDAETTAFKIDMEAADEICRQLKLRDLGGVIICDYIDLRYERHRRELERRIHENLKNDRAKTKVLRMSEFGIVEMTRQRMRPSLKRSVYFDCPHCKGAGLVKTPESMSLDVMRRLRIAIHDLKVQRAELAVCPDVAFYLQNKKRVQLGDLEIKYKKRILIRADAQLGLDEMKIDLYDSRDGLVFIEELGMFPQPPHTTQLHTKPAHFPQKGGRQDRGDRGRRQQQGHRQQPAARDVEEDYHEERYDRGEEEFEDRGERAEAAGEEAGMESDRGAPDPRHDRDQRPDQRPQDRRRHEQPARGDQRGGGQGRGQGRGQNRDRGRERFDQRDERHAPGGSNNGAEEVEPASLESASLETEAGSEAAPPSEAINGSGPGENLDQQGSEGGPRRGRRRRRGRRGRGRNRQLNEGQDQQPAVGGGPDANEPDRDERAESMDRQEGESFAHEDEAADVGDRQDTGWETPERAAHDQPTEAERQSERDFAGYEEPANEFDRIREAESVAYDREPDLAEPEPTAEREPEPMDIGIEESPAAPAADEAPAEKPKGRGRKPAKPKAPKAAKAVKAPRKPAPRGKPKKSAADADTEAPAAVEPRPPEPKSAVRSASADRHLIDEPAFQPPVRGRPRSARDLDHIPDDFD